MIDATHPEKAVAIIGMGLRFPGGADSVSTYWKMLLDGVNAVGEIPSDRMDVSGLYAETPATPGRIMTRFGGFLDGIDRFDADFFGISQREAERMDPQHRLMLETAWHAIEDAQIKASSLSGKRVGVYVGQWLSDFEARLMRHPERTDFEMTGGSGRYATAGRLSFFFGLEGPSLTLDTACSSSLTAVHLAIQSLRSGETEMAFAGGVNVILSPHITVGYSQSRMMAPDGRCKFGDETGDGYVRSEGAGMVLLKRLDRALADGDRIRAVLRGSAINNDGRSSGLMGRPAVAGQKALLSTALEDAGVQPEQIGYVEAHGTGTAAGDPVELTALGQMLGTAPQRSDPLLVGSVKTNIGHTEGAAGLAGLLKAGLAVQTGQIPPSRNLSNLNPKIDWDGLHLRIPVTATDWPGQAHKRCAVVCSFGISGSNAQVVVEEPPARPDIDHGQSADAPLVLPLSAACKPGLRDLALKYADLLKNADDETARTLCAMVPVGRSALRERAVFAARNREDLIAHLSADDTEKTALSVGTSGATRPRLIFVAPGQGGQWVGMGRALYESEPAFRQALDACEAELTGLVDWSLIGQLKLDPADDGFLLDRIEVIQPALVALAIAYARLWQSKGVIPDAVVGHSMGEVAAAAIAGLLNLKDAMRIVVKRSSLMAQTSGQGGMALIEAEPEAIAAMLQRHDGQLSLAAVNGPRNCVISGANDALDALLSELEGQEIFCRRIKVDVASHSPQMAPLADALQTELAGLTPGPGQIAMVSTVTGAQIEGPALDPSYWARNLRQPVQFQSALEQAVSNMDAIVIELGPHPVLLPSITDISSNLETGLTGIPTTTRDQVETKSFGTALASLWTCGVAVNWTVPQEVYRGQVDLPLYPWQTRRYWLEEAELSMGATDGAAPAILQPTERSYLHRPVWQPTQGTPQSERQSTARWFILAEDADFTRELTGELEKSGCIVETGSLAQMATMTDCPDGIIVAGFAPDGNPYLPLDLLQHLPQGYQNAPPRLIFLTRGAHLVTNEDTGADTDQAAMWGAAQGVATEHPELDVQLHDLDPKDSDAGAAEACLASLFSEDGENQTAVRRGQRYALRLVADLDRTPNATPPWRKDAACLITGGLGGVGARIAKVAAHQGARHIVLLGRTALPDRSRWGGADLSSQDADRVQLIREIENLGSSVHYIQVDLSDKTAVSQALERYENEARPPVKTLIHAAGHIENGLATDMSQDQFDRVMQAKYRGAQHLDALLPDLDLFVAFSSVARAFAPAGMANYVAANAALEALVAQRNAKGQPALFIGWSVWPGVGTHREGQGAANSTELERLGVRAVAPESSEAIFSWMCRNRLSATVMDVDWSAHAEAVHGQPAPVFRLLVGTGRRTPSKIQTDLAELDTAGRKDLLVQFIRDNLGEILDSDPSEIDPQRPLGSFGLNSLMGIELRNRLEAALDKALPATLIWNHPTVSALAAHLAGADPARAASRKTEKANAPLATELDDLMQDLLDSSDDDILSDLRNSAKGPTR